MRRAGRGDGVIVGKLAVGRADEARGDVDRLHFLGHDLDVFVFGENGADWRGNVGRRERGGGDLVEEGLEEVVVSLVDDRDPNGQLRQSAYCVQPAETSPDDDDVWFSLRSLPLFAAHNR